MYCKTFGAALVALFMTLSSAQADIRVNGEGSVSVPPDMATVSVGVVTESENVKDAMTLNNTRVRGVFKALSECGIEKKCFETTQFSVSPKTVYNQNTRESKIVGYTVVNQVSVKVHELDSLGDVLTAVTENGANNIGSIAFGVTNMDDAVKVARQRATADALARAKLYCESLGVSVGNVVEISEQSVSQPRFARYEMQAVRALSEAVPVSAGGDKAISVSVSVTFSIDGQEEVSSGTLR